VDSPRNPNRFLLVCHAHGNTIMPKLRIALLASAAAFPLAPALAQTAAPEGAIALPTVEVTATQGGEGGGGPPESPGEKAGYSAPPVARAAKIDTPIFDLPISVQTVPEQVIVDQNAIKIEDALQNVSGVRANNNNIEGYAFNIRGFQTLNVFRDGQLVSSVIPQTYDTANLQRLEVLKGPASFLFGRADPGGVINRVTKKPLDAPYYSITQEIGSFNLLRTVWDLAGPVQVPVLADGAVSYRLSGAYTDGGQFVDFTRTRNLFLAPAITWQIDPATTWTVGAE
jgi:iron complex outermembrane receptor protein